jgi:hypothetical protein
LRPALALLFGLTRILDAQTATGPNVPVSLDVPLGTWGIPVPIQLPEIPNRILRTQPRLNAPVAFVPDSGEKFVPVGQSIRVVRPWLMIARDTFTLRTGDGPRPVVKGDTLYGMAGNYVWYRGRLDTLAEGSTYPKTPKVRSICSQRITFWLQFRRDNGQTGWLEYGVVGTCRGDSSQGAG